MLERLYMIMDEIIPGKDYKTALDLVDSKTLTSMNIVKLVSRLNDEFDVEITPLHLVPANFNSVEAMLELVEDLDGE